MKSLMCALRVFRIICGTVAAAGFLYVMGTVGSAELGNITVDQMIDKAALGFALLISGAAGVCLLDIDE